MMIAVQQDSLRRECSSIVYLKSVYETRESLLVVEVIVRPRALASCVQTRCSHATYRDRLALDGWIPRRLHIESH